jgi:hypothetical protein
MATRLRRGKVVEIPARWLGNVTTPQTIRSRASKLPGKVKRRIKDYASANRYKDLKDLPLGDD